MSNRNLFSELSSALVEAKQHSEGKLTLKTHEIRDTGERYISPVEILSIRQQFNMSRGVFAKLLHTSSRTLENWEQGRSAPIGQAVTLLRLVQRYPGALAQIAEL